MNFSLIGRHFGQRRDGGAVICLGFDRQLVPLRVQTLLVRRRALGLWPDRIVRRLRGDSCCANTTFSAMPVINTASKKTRLTGGPPFGGWSRLAITS